MSGYTQKFLLCSQGTKHFRIKHKQSQRLRYLGDTKYSTDYEPVKSMPYLSQFY